MNFLQYPTAPRNDLNSFFVSGLLTCRILFVVPFWGDNSPFLTKWPRPPTLWNPNKHLLGLLVMRCSFIVSWCGHVVFTLSVQQNLANAFIKPKSIQWNYISPRSVWNGVRFLSSSPMGICQNPLVKSIFEIYFPNLLCTNSILGIGSASKSSRVQIKSMHYLSEPPSCLTITVGLAYCEVDDSAMPSPNIFQPPH